jgi:hypothetical protein
VDAIPRETLLEEFGFDAAEQQKAREYSTTQQLNEMIKKQIGLARAQGEAQLISAKYQGLAQEELQTQSIRYKINLFKETLIQELDNPMDDIFNIIEQIALNLKNLPDEIRNQQLYLLQQTKPTTFGLVMERLSYYMMQQIQMQAAQQGLINAGATQEPVEGAKEEKAPNEKEPGERKEDQVPIKGEKHKGVTKGEA